MPKSEKFFNLKIGLAQMNPIVGDLSGNRAKIVDFIKKGEQDGCDFIIFPEMAITGYPIADLIFKHKFVDENLKVLQDIASSVTKSHVIIGCVRKVNKRTDILTPFYNSAAIISPDHSISFINKHLLPNYDLFDEKRYFSPANDLKVFDFEGLNYGVEICEDLWDSEYATKVTHELKKRGANCIFIINASPYFIDKPLIRENLVKKHAKEEHIPIVYLNLVGGQDEMTFDGRSIIVDSDGKTVFRLPAFEECFKTYNLHIPLNSDQNVKSDRISLQNPSKDIDLELKLNKEEDIFNALVLNLRDYYYKTGVFKKIVLGLSGGIDSGFTAVVACRAVGPENVTGILMPSKFSSDHSVTDAIQISKNLGMEYIITPIKDVHKSFDNVLKEAFKVNSFTIADENLQSRIRGVILMYYSNKFDALVVSTGNKSEVATGYCTLYGDTNGGKNVPGDLYKGQIYKISNWLNEVSQKEGKGKIIPQGSIDKAPSAELKDNQKDQDSLPPYDELDAILVELIENNLSVDEIIAKGMNPATVKRVEKMYHNAEYKRAQLAQTIRVTKKSFGIGRRYPIINKYHITKDKI